MRIASLSEIPEGGLLSVKANGVPLVLARFEERVYALKDECTHVSAPLGDGLLDGCEIECPWHYARFDVRSGEPTDGPAYDAVPVFEVEVRDGDVFVSL